MTIKPHFENREGVLHIQGYDAQELVQQYGSPLYVYDETRVIDNINRLNNAFSSRYEKFKIFVAVKSNNNLSFLKIAQNLGHGLDCSSPGEIFLAERIGMPSNRISYTGNYQSDSELAYGLESGAIMNLDDVSLLPRLLAIGVPEIVSFRLNPGIGNGEFEQIICGGEKAKFGVSMNNIISGYRLARDAGVRRFGIHMMTGSSILDQEYFQEITRIIVGVAGQLKTELGIDIEFINLGGGFGIPYDASQNVLDIDVVAESVVGALEEGIEFHGLIRPYLYVEPGRYFYADTGVLLTTVTAIKKENETYVGLDAGMNVLMRPALYGVRHNMVAAGNLNAERTMSVNFCGQICENTDIFERDVHFSNLSVGDLIGIMDVGAYGFAMSTQYNGRPRIAEVLVNLESTSLIRERETFDNLCQGVIIPQRLLEENAIRSL